MSEVYQICEVGDSVREWAPKAQPNQKNLAYQVKFREQGDEWVEWSRRIASERPSVNDFTPPGNITDGPYGKVFKVDWDAAKAESGHGSPQKPRTPDYKAAAGSPTGETQDARQRSIVRQSSQKQAIEFLKACGSTPPPSSPPEFTPEWLEIHLSPIIDWFASDAGGEARPKQTTEEQSDARFGGDVPF